MSGLPSPAGVSCGHLGGSWLSECHNSNATPRSRTGQSRHELTPRRQALSGHGAGTLQRLTKVMHSKDEATPRAPRGDFSLLKGPEASAHDNHSTCDVGCSAAKQTPRSRQALPDILANVPTPLSNITQPKSKRTLALNGERFLGPRASATLQMVVAHRAAVDTRHVYSGRRASPSQSGASSSSTAAFHADLSRVSEHDHDDDAIMRKPDRICTASSACSRAPSSPGGAAEQTCRHMEVANKRIQAMLRLSQDRTDLETHNINGLTSDEISSDACQTKLQREQRELRLASMVHRGELEACLAASCQPKIDTDLRLLELMGADGQAMIKKHYDSIECHFKHAAYVDRLLAREGRHTLACRINETVSAGPSVDTEDTNSI